MSRRIPQRNANLAAKMMSTGLMCIGTSQLLVDPTKELPFNSRDLEDSLLDTLAAIREYKRKVNPIELKGQRA
jgi:hypothetical protein